MSPEVSDPQRQESWDQFSCALGYEHSAQALANGEWYASDPWLSVASRLTRLSPVD